MTIALHGPLHAASTQLASDVDLIQASTRQLLLVVLGFDAADHLAWLELTHVDLTDDYTVASIPDAALDAVATHFHDDANSPLAPLVAA